MTPKIQLRQLYTQYLLIVLFISFSLVCNSQTTNDSSTLKYENSKHKISAYVLKNWTLQEEFENAAMKVFIVQWILPKVYSEIEKTDIANAVSITCLSDPSIRNTNALVDYELLRISDVIVKKDKLSDRDNSYTIYTKIDGLNYKSKYYFIYINNVGYIINFTATEGTYDKNLKTFDKFFHDLAIKE